MYIECNHSDEKLALEYEIPDLPLAAPTGRMRVRCECGRTGRWARSVVGAVREWDNRDYDTTKAHLEAFRGIYARAIQNDNATVWEAELHLENLILNLRADLGVLRQERDGLIRERDAYRDALMRLDSYFY